MIMREDSAAATLPPVPLMLGIAAACVVSVLLVWLVGEQSIVALAYGGALVAVLLTILLTARLRTVPIEETTLQPDWSVTSAAIENRRRGVAIIDRANRMVCANSTYERW